MQQLALVNPWKGAPVCYRERTGSTMEDALALALAGAPGGTVAAAGYQSRGQGRLAERSWLAEPGRNLLFTLILRENLPFPLQRLPVLAGLALSLAVEGLYGLETRVKWPNDLLAGDKKLAGILCRAHGPVCLVGIGLNCNQRRFPPGPAAAGCSLYQLTGGEVALHPLLERILAEIKAVLADAAWKEKLLARLAWLGERLVVQSGLPAGKTGEATAAGTLAGIADDGALLLRPEAGGELVAVAAGQIRRT